ncbi:LPS-assembly lipoprotein LptE [Xylophilus sp.]|uniref:LPS-assembly lipoprotein LptE n=1 Tax=Xylophilus sp. TaxID=2653893 RepID=UPI0013B98DD6|nr:LPS assembly lipoprotein LptE [Xylophilus sp.]KAF1044873.1 MAG: LPS-assembly lipoprotein LptE [Xylophilus sp.]
MQRRLFLLGASSALLLAGCGFKLREAPTYAFSSIYIVPTGGSTALLLELQRNLESFGTVRVLRDAAAAVGADVWVEVTSEAREQVVVGYNATGGVRELQVRLRVHFKLRTAAGKELIPDTELLLRRDVTYSETLALAKEAEIALLSRDMQTDAVQQIVRRLGAVKSL